MTIALAIGGAAAAAKTTASSAKVVKRVVIVENGHKVTVTTFVRSGKTYKRKQWASRAGGHIVLHTYTYLVKGAKAKKVSSSSKKESGKGAVAEQMVRTCSPGDPGAAQAAYDTFWKHFQAAHLQASPGQQASDILDVDNYVKLHTALIENMITPAMSDSSGLTPALEELVGIFAAHVQGAHLQESPFQQATDIVTDPDGYVKLHTVLVGNMIKPLVDWANEFGQGTSASCTEAPASGTAGAAGAAKGDQTIHIAANRFPAETDIAKGTKVTWVNDDAVPHTVSSMHGGPLKSGNLNKGASYSYTFGEAGTYMYVCDVHPDMQSEVVVK